MRVKAVDSAMPPSWTAPIPRYNSEPAPLETTPKLKPAPPREVVFEKVLQSGDVLYVPRGTYHRAAVTDTDSVHLTFGIHAFKGLRFIDGIRKAAEKNGLPVDRITRVSVLDPYFYH